MLQSYMQIMQTHVALDIRVWVDWEKNFEIPPLTVALIDVKWCFTLLDLYKSSVFVCSQNDKENTVVTLRSQQESTSPKFHSTQKVADMVILRVIVCSLWAMWNMIERNNISIIDAYIGVRKEGVQLNWALVYVSLSFVWYTV